MRSHSGLFTKIYKDIINDQVNLPHLPDVAIKLRKVLADDNYSVDVIARLIQTDASASAYLLNIANSMLYKTRVTASDIPSAIRIMGISSVKNLINVYAFRSITATDNASTQKHLNAYWQKSAYQAAIAHAIAKMVKGVDADMALLAGLLQSVGALPILMKLDGTTMSSLNDEDVEAALTAYTAKVGVVLAQKWHLEEALQNVIKYAENYAYDGGATIDLVDVVNIAKLFSQIGSKNIQWPRIEDAPCLKKFCKDGLTLAYSMELLKEAQNDIKETKKILN